MKLYTNEIVFRGHPDKVCDQISGAILRECIKQDPGTHAGIEVMGGKGKIFVTGEVATNAEYDVEEIVRRVLWEVGYRTDYEVIDNLGKQSQDINQGVDLADGEVGAGDQGMMFGYACDDTLEMLPKAMVILQKLARAYDILRVLYDDFLPDGKAQITGVYDDDFRLIRIKDFVISYQNREVDRDTTDMRLKELCWRICRDCGIENFHINPTGKFLIGGFDADAGLTGRKIVVDSYQSFANVGGGCMNGKDPSKVDFSASHKAREIAKRVLKEHKLRWCEVQLSYAIGIAEPMAIYVDSNKGNIEPSPELYEECKPKNIIRDLRLLSLDYQSLAEFGHFRD